MTCIKTGADVYLAGRCCIIHGDLFEVGDCYILVVQGSLSTQGDYDIGGKVNLNMLEWEECGSSTLVAEKDWCDDFTYEGH